MGLDVQTILDAAAANGQGKIILVEDNGNVVLPLHTTGTTTATIKFYGSVSETAPDFTAAQSPSNSYEALEVVDLEDGAPIDGSAGIALSAAAATNRMFELNTNHMRWITAVISGYSSGAITVRAKVGDLSH